MTEDVHKFKWALLWRSRIAFQTTGSSAPSP
jgi:hypothetical protein